MPNRETRRRISFLLVFFASITASRALAQQHGDFPFEAGAPPESAQLPPPNQLENLVAPVALYPDQLLSQLLAASTHPLEIVEAQQWLQRNSNLRGPKLLDAAKQQNWDPSVQALVIFPDAMSLLTRDIQWTTALGNAFLAQQADAMDAIQRMRSRAEGNGRLASTPQEIVTRQQQYGQSAIQIQPADPRMIYVPSYNPQDEWGPPAEGDYPQLGYQNSGDGQSSSFEVGQLFGAAVNLASYFTGSGGLLGGNGWGWGLNWLTHSLFSNGLFLNDFGFQGGGSNGGGSYSGGSFGGSLGAQSAWVHNPGHRGGVPYSDRAVASRFEGRFRPAGAGFAGVSRGGWRTPAGARSVSQRTFGDGFAGGSGEGSWRSAESGRSFGNSYGNSFGNSFAGSRSSANRGFMSSTNGGSGYGSSGRGFGGYGSGAYGSRSFPSGISGWAGSRSAGYSPGAMSFRGSADYSSRGNGGGNRNSLLPERGRGSSRDSGFKTSAPHFSNPRSSQRFSAPRASSKHFSAPHISKSHSSGGHSSGGRGSGGRSSKGHSSGGHSHKH